MNGAATLEELTALSIIVSLERDLRTRRVEIDRAASEAVAYAVSASPNRDVAEGLRRSLLSAQESYLNCVDRFCWCFVTYPFSFGDWREDYAGVLANCASYLDLPEFAGKFKNIRTTLEGV